MKKIFYILILCLLSKFSYSQTSWPQVGNTLQRGALSGVAGGYRFRTNLGTPGYAYWYTSQQIDSLIALVVSGGCPSCATLSGSNNFTGPNQFQNTVSFNDAVSFTNSISISPVSLSGTSSPFLFMNSDGKVSASNGLGFYNGSGITLNMPTIFNAGATYNSTPPNFNNSFNFNNGDDFSSQSDNRILVYSPSDGNRVGYLSLNNLDVTASNGLTKSVNDIQLGGDIVSDVSVNVTGVNTLNFTNATGNVSLRIQPANPSITMEALDGGIGGSIAVGGTSSGASVVSFVGSPNSSTLQIDNTKMEVLDDINQTGLVYHADYSATGSLNNRWIPDWGAVKSLATTASNGLTKTGNNVKLGGTLINNTTIDAAGNRFDIYNGVTSVDILDGSLNASVGDNTNGIGELSGSPGSIGLISVKPDASIKQFKLDQSRITIQDIDGVGIENDDDYHASYPTHPRALVDVGYVNSLNNSKVDTASTNQRPYGTFYNKNSWASLTDFASPTATVSVVSNALSFSGGTSDFTKTLNLSSYTMVDKQVIVVAGRPGATTSSFGPTTGSGSPATAIFNRTGISGTIELYVGSSTLVATSPALTFSAGDRIVITLERDGIYLKATAYNQTTRSTNVVAYYNYNTTITSNPLLPRTGQVGVVSYSGAFTVDSIRYATSAIKNAQIAVMGTSKSQYYDVSDVSRGYVSIIGSKYGNVLQHSGQSDATAQALLSLPELIALKPKIVLDEMECNDVRLGVPIATTMANVRNYTAQLNAAGITVYHLLPFYEKIGTGGAVNLQPMVDSLKAAFPTTYIDTYTPTYNCASCVAADGVHTTDEGNPVIANTIINFFNDKIKPGKNINQSFQAFKGITTQSVIINDNITSLSTAGTNYLNSLVNAYPTGNAFTSFSVGQNSTSQYLAMTYENSTFVTSGINQPNTGYLITGSGATGGLVVAVTGANPLKYSINGSFKGGISLAGNFLFGTNTDASTGVIQATGNVAVTGNINATTYSAINSTATITSTGNAINNFAAVNSGTASNQFIKGKVNNVDVFAAGWDLSANEVYSGAIDSRIYALRTANIDRFQISAAGVITVPGLNTAGIVTTNAAGTFSISAIVPVGFGGTGQSSFTNGQLLIGNTTGSTLTKATLTGSAGTGMVITNGAGSITLSNDTTILATKANSYTLAQMQAKLNGYVPIAGTTTITGIKTFTPIQFFSAGIAVGTTGSLQPVTFQGSVNTTALYALNPSTNRTINLPDNNGTVALLSDITATKIAVVRNNASTLTLVYGTPYVFYGTTATYTLPAVSGTNNTTADIIRIKNAGSGNLTINSNSGSTIYDGSLVGTITLSPGGYVELLPDGVQFNKG